MGESAAPSGTVTFLFTDIEGSTRLWESAPEAMRDALARHDQLLRTSVAEHGGHVFSTGGDGLAAAFARAADAAHAARAAQARLGDELWASDAQIKVRMALHTGEAHERDGDYFGPALNRTARLMALGHGGQILCSRVTADLLDGSVPLVDLGEHRLRDLLAPERVLQIGDELFPPVQSVDSVPSNLPTMVTELVGRTEEIAQFVETLKTERLLTLTGVGGVGKTRLALAVAASLAPEFADGCWLAELAPVADGADVERAVCATLGAPAIATSTSAGLRNYLENRRLVLVLDNCEHVVDDCARLADLILNAAREVHLIITSREPLGVDGEVVRRVRSLELPEETADLEVARNASSIRLFLDRAVAASESFALTSTNVGEVIEICRKLDGIPLAIELAAARVGSMPVADIARRLDERFRLLAGGRRAQERHRTLQAAVSWSYELLTPVEREVFQQLAVFPASFALAAVETIVTGEHFDGIDAVDATVRLAERSLVQYDPASGRYRLLETLRQFATDRLAESGNSDAVRDRYAAHYSGLVALHAPGMFDERYETTNAVLAPELDNIRTAVDWLIRCERWRDLYELCHVSAVSFLANYTTSEGFQWYQTAVTSDAVTDPQERVDALGEMSGCASQVGVHEIADAMALESIELAQREGVEHSPWAWFSRSMAALYTANEVRQELSLKYAYRMRDAVLARENPPGLRMLAESLTIAPLTELARFDEADAVAGRLLEEAAALDNSMVLSIAVVTTTSAYLVSREQPDGQAALAVFDAYDHLLTSPGLLMDTWISAMRALALTTHDLPAAVRAGVHATRGADRAGSPAALAVALDLLSYAVALTGRIEIARRIAGTVDEMYLPINPGAQWYRARRDELLGPVKGGPAPKPTRQELMAILTELEVN